MYYLLLLLLLNKLTVNRRSRKLIVPLKKKNILKKVNLASLSFIKITIELGYNFFIVTYCTSR